MKRSWTLPTEQQLIRLAGRIVFPVTRDELVAVATEHGHAASTIIFLRMFGEDDVFENGVDFINQCEELKMLLREKHDSPIEHLRSPQE